MPDVSIGCSAENAAEFVVCMTEKAAESAESAARDAENWADESVAASDGLVSVPARVEDPFIMSAVEPEIPTVDGTRSIYGTERDILLGLFKDLFSDFLNILPIIVFAPARSAAASWLSDTIINGATGIPAALENQIWARGRDKILAENETASRAVSEAAAARGWVLPPGFAMAALQSSRMTASRAIGEYATEVAKKQAEIAIESVRFAVAEALKVHLGNMGLANDFLNAMRGAVVEAAKIAEIDPNAQATMISAMSDLYRARIQYDQTKANALEGFHQRVVSDNQLFVDAVLKKLGIQVQARESASDTLARVSQAWLSQLSSITSIALSG